MKRNIHSLISYNLEWLMISHQGLVDIISFDEIFCFCGYLFDLHLKTTKSSVYR